MVQTLADLIAPSGEDVLLRHSAQRQRFHFKGADLWRKEALLSWDDFQALIDSRRVPVGQLGVTRDGKALAQIMYRDRATGETKPAALWALYRQGATIVVNRIHELVPAIEGIVRDLRAVFGSVAGANLYVTGGVLPGFPPHHDGHDVLAVQLLGAKRWQGFGLTALAAASGGADDIGPRAPAWEDVVSAGDLLFLPRGEIHRVLTVESPSMHLTFSIEARFDA